MHFISRYALTRRTRALACLGLLGGLVFSIGGATAAGALSTAACKDGVKYKASTSCTLPSNVSSVVLEAAGAAGGAGGDGAGDIVGGAGGQGSVAIGTYDVFGGDVLAITVGTTGKNGQDGDPDGTGGAGGGNGGGQGGGATGPNANLGGGGGGGGYSGANDSTRDLFLVVVGGGGGGGGGGNSQQSNSNDNGGAGGSNQGSGGNGEGTGGSPNASGGLNGGAGGTGNENEAGGGGGGGGCDGGSGGTTGGGGDNGSGGGGGAGVDCGDISSVLGGNSGNGYVEMWFTPKIKAFSPTKGGAGATVTITGKNLTGATSVLFNGTQAKILKDSATSITTRVPKGASSGNISVTTPGGTATSKKWFTVS